MQFLKFFQKKLKRVLHFCNKCDKIQLQTKKGAIESWKQRSTKKLEKKSRKN